MKEIERKDDSRFTTEIESVVQEAETHRLKFMRRHKSRSLLSLTLGLVFMLAGAGGFGWFFLMEADITKALACMALALILPLLLNIWTNGPIKAYIRDYKIGFMPKMAKAIGGFQFHQNRGISGSILAKTGIVPSFTKYQAEDCFMGRYKGIKVLFSEARLYNKKEPSFDGIFALLEIPEKVIEGHTIISSDENKIARWSQTRWSKLSPVPLSSENPDWKKFSVFSNKPEAASLLVGDKLLKELYEASAVFEHAPVSLAMFKGKYIFMMIEAPSDMFEASNMFIPITTKTHALKCKREIERVLEIVDVFDIYASNITAPDTN